MKREPETYDEIIRQKRCYDLAKYYNVTEEDFSQKCQISFKEYMHNYLENNFLLY